MSTPSYDPRINRAQLPDDSHPYEDTPLLQWQTYEVFQQQQRGEQHVHVGAIHAPNPEMALVLAKEQFGRREQCANLWVVKSGDIHATPYEDADMFQHAFDKTYREGSGYRVKDTIETFKKQLGELLGETDAAGQSMLQATATVIESQGVNCRVIHLHEGPDKRIRKIIIPEK